MRAKTLGRSERRSHIERRSAGRLGQRAERAGCCAAATEVRTPPRAIRFAYLCRQFLLMKVVDRQGENERTYEQRDHSGQPQSFGIWLHCEALFLRRLRHKDRSIVAKFGHRFWNERNFAMETLDCRQGAET